MACYHPIKAIQYKSSFYPSGKGIIRILRKDELDKSWNDDVDLLQLPCGQCAGCRMDYARQWANRLMLELENYASDRDSCHFLTLTIDSNHINDRGDEPRVRGDLPSLHVLRPYADPDTGVLAGWSHSLSKNDLQLFMKRLRRQHPDDKVRFFAVGEYGSLRKRPHYHLILFGLHLPDDDLVFWEKSELGYDYNQSKSIQKIWPYGMNVVAPVTWESCCYVARYMLKKIKGEGRELYDRFNIQEPFTLMSRRPGIARQYYEDHGMDIETVSFVVGGESGSRSFPPPRYLEKLFELDDPEGAKERRQRRRVAAEAKQDIHVQRTGLSPEQYLKREEEKFLHAVKFLDSVRNL